MATNGLDYIKNYYAILDLEETASEKDISQKIRERRASVHPDRLLNVDQKIREKADEVRAQIDEAAGILLDQEKREKYDQKLSYFKEKDSRLVTLGHAVQIVGGEQTMNLSKLLHEKQNFEIDLSSLGLTGFNQEEFQMIEGLYQTDEKNETFRKLYKKQLEKKLESLIILEQTLWMNAGIFNKKDQSTLVNYPDDYSSNLETEISTLLAEIPQRLEKRKEIAAIGLASPLKMLTTDGQQEKKAELVAQTQAEIQQKIIKSFLERTEKLKELAKQKEETLTKLLKLTEYTYLGEAVGTEDLDVLLAFELEGILSVQVVFTVSTKNHSLTFNNSHPALKKRNSDINQSELSNDTILVINNPKITATISQITYVVDQHLEKFSKED